MPSGSVPQEPETGTSEVIARSPKKPPWLWVQLIVQSILFAYWANKFRDRGDADVAIVITVGFFIILVLSIAAVFGYQRVTLVLTDDSVTLQRRWRPIAVARTEIRAVRGEIPGRPSWSSSLVLELDDERTVTLPTFGQTGKALVPRMGRRRNGRKSPSQRSFSLSSRAIRLIPRAHRCGPWPHRSWRGEHPPVRTRPRRPGAGRG